MPKSCQENKKPVMDLLKTLGSKNILELGVGYGDFGPKIRLEIPGSRLFGIEIFKPYFIKIPKVCYERLYNEDIRPFYYEKLKDIVDTVMMIDVLEHLTEDDGKQLLNKLESLFEKIVISVPVIDFEQPAFMGNDWEEHKSQWKPDDMISMGYKEFFKGEIIGVYYKCLN